MGDRCLAVWSGNLRLYEANIIDIDKEKNSCRVKYCKYDNEEDRPLVAVCPEYGRRSSIDDQHRQNRQKRDKREEYWQVHTLCY